MRPLLNAPLLNALLLAGVVGTVGLTSCKRSVAPKVDEVWDEAPPMGQAEALRSLSPPWGAPTRAVLDNGLITFWLHEADAPAAHVRLLIPVEGEHGPLPIAEVAIVQAHLVRALGQRTRNRGMTVEARSAPGRIEVVIHTASSDTASALGAIATVLSVTNPGAALEAARADVAGTLAKKTSAEIRATTALVEALLTHPPNTEHIERAAVKSATAPALRDAWQAMVDPRRVVLVVHSGDTAATHRNGLRQLSDRWRAFGRRPVPPTALARLRSSDPGAPHAGRILAEPATPLVVLPGDEGKPVLMLGRVIPTASPLDRSMARLAQRVMQEEVDARLVLHGDYAIFVMRVPLAGREPEKLTTEAIDSLVALANARQPQQRLFQAAQLWLGARVVQSSLDGEDWSALWSEAMELADSDDAIANALAHDAAQMLELEAEALQTWQRKWLDPRSGEPGWRWFVAGASEREIRRLARIAPVQP